MTPAAAPVASRGEIALDTVRLDGGTQVRMEISEALVTEYAERMREGAQFPPIVVFSDGVQVWLADGFHRVRAARQVGLSTLAAEIRIGTSADALWYALGANGAHGQRLTGADRKHAIQLALVAFPQWTGSEIARQIGCSHQWVSDVKRGMRVQATCTMPDVVTGKDGRQYQTARFTHPTPHPRTAEILAALRAGRAALAIAADLRVSTRTVAKLRKEAGLDTIDRSPAAIGARSGQIRTMAREGYTSRQICAAVQLSRESVRTYAKRDGIDIYADRAVGKTVRHDSTRIVSRIVMDAENLIEGTELINYGDLDPAQIPEWLRSLQQSRDNLGKFIRRLMQERATYGDQNAEP